MLFAFGQHWAVDVLTVLWEGLEGEGHLLDVLLTEGEE